VEYEQQTCGSEPSAIWNLARLSGKGSVNYNYPSSGGNGITSYIIDTGIRTTHDEFKDGGRATWGTNTVGGPDEDCNGHGTHVAGTVAGTLYGVAKEAKVVAVKVLDCDGSGSYAAVVDGIEFVNANCKTKSTCNANMSLGGPYSKALDDAVRGAIGNGIAFIVAAGNSDDDACYYSPADVATAISVGASDASDRRASFSNYGTCVSVFAPGTNIKAAWYTANNAYNTIQGTSMASPHVAGAVSILQTAGSQTPSMVKSKIVAGGFQGAINLNCGTGRPGCTSTPTALLQVNCASA